MHTHIELKRRGRHRERERGLHESRPIPRERPRMADVPCFFFHSSVSSFAFLSRVRDLETVDRVRCNYPPFGPLAGPFRSPLAGSPPSCFQETGEREAEFAGSPIGTGQEARARHGRAATFPIPRADGHRQSETAHEILHGENLRVRAAFPLITTRGNRPFRSRGGTWTVRCNHVHVVSIRQFLPPPPPPPSLFYSILFHRRRVLPFVRLPFYSAIFAPLSLSLSLSWIRSYLMYGTPPSSAGRTLVRLVFDADHSPLSCGSARFPRSNRLLRLYKRARVRGPRIRGENSLSRLDPAGWDLRAYVCTWRAQRKMFLRDRRGPRRLSY